MFDSTIEVPVTIRDPDKPIGTHVFTAMARNDAGLRWTVVTIDNGDNAKDRARPHHHPAGSARSIAPAALPRSSIIVSDEPLSHETNYRTEFVAVLNNQPQGGFVTRRPTVASGNFGLGRRLRLFRGQFKPASWQATRPPSAGGGLVMVRPGALRRRTHGRLGPAGLTIIIRAPIAIPAKYMPLMRRPVLGL